MTDALHDALLFDGKSAAATPVRLALGGGVVSISTPEGVLLEEHPLAAITLGEAFASAPRQLGLPGGAVIEVPAGAALTEALAGAGRPPGLVDRLEARWGISLLAVAACVGLLALGYVRGLPALARWGAAAVSAETERRIGEGVLEALEGTFLGPSRLTAEEQRTARDRIERAARLGAPSVEFHLLFRRVGFGNDTNAFALPGGTVVLLDGLVRGTGGDERLVAVVGHELGHVARRHSLQALLKNAGVGAVASVLWGDFSGQVAAVPTALAMFDYSRDAEREADEDALRFLAAAGLTAEPMMDALCLLQDLVREEPFAAPRLLSSHPKLAERIEHVRALGGIEPTRTCPAPAPQDPPAGPPKASRWPKEARPKP